MSLWKVIIMQKRSCSATVAIPWYTFLYLFLSQTCCWLFICITVVTWLCCSIDCATWYMFPVVNEMIYVSLWSLILLVNQFRPMLWVNAEVIVIRTPAIECIGWWVLLNTFYLSQNACLWIMLPIHSTSIGTNWLAICSILYHLTFFLNTYLSWNRPLPLMCFHCQPT